MNKQLLLIGGCALLAGSIIAGIGAGTFTDLKLLSEADAGSSSPVTSASEIEFSLPAVGGEYYNTDGYRVPTSGRSNWTKRYVQPATETTPSVTIQLAGGNMNYVTDILTEKFEIAANNTNGSITAITVGDDLYYVKKVGFDMVTKTGSVNYTDGTSTWSATTEGTHFEWEAENVTDVFPTLTISGGGSCYLENFKVLIDKKTPDLAYHLPAEGGNYYRNNAITTGNNLWCHKYVQPATDSYPELTINFQAGNMLLETVNATTKFNVAANNAGGNLSSIIVDSDDYYIKSVSFDMVTNTGSVSYNDGSNTYTATSEGTHFEWIAESENDVMPLLTISGSGANPPKCYLENFTVVVGARTVDPNDPELVAGEGEELMEFDFSDWNVYRDNAATTDYGSKALSNTNKISIETSVNNLKKPSGGSYLILAGGLTRSSEFQILPEDWHNYYVSGFSFIMKTDGSGSALNITSGDHSKSSTAGYVRYTRQDIPESEINASFVASGANLGIDINEIKVLVKKREYPVPSTTDVMIYDGSADHNVVYRIPSIATVCDGDNKGRLLAVADYRHSGQDIGVGTGLVDLHLSYSDNGGETWSEPMTLRDADGNEVTKGTGDKSAIDCGFGDPAIVADRESEEVLLIACAGYPGFAGSTLDNPQNIVSWTSNDGGKTWSNYNDLTTVLRDIFTESGDYAPFAGMFIGSGRMVQSSRIKVGDYYRVYAALSGRNTSGNNSNWVIYSDDFGKTWNILGDPAIPVVASNGDEPKVEELPDGAVIFSGRVSGGRNFNMFHYTDIAKGEGNWSGARYTKILDFNLNACNGDLLILPAKNKADGSITTLVLHSMPLGDNSRKNVGVLWKVLDTTEELATVDGFASDWDGYMTVSFTGSAYSSMSVKDDGNIAFLYEEDTYGRSYSIVYLTLSIDEITKGAYTKVEEGDEVADTDKPVFTEEMLNCFIENSGITNQIILNKIAEIRDELLVNPTYEGYAEFMKMLKTVAEVNDLGGYYVGGMAPSSVEAYIDALIAYEADSSEENAKHLENCRTYAHTLILKNDVAYRFNNRNHPTEFMAVGEDNTLIGTEDAASDNSLFHLRAASAENLYRLHHNASDKYVEVQANLNTPHNMVEADGDVAEIAMNPVAGTNFFNLVVNNPKNEEYPALHLNDSHHVVIWRTPHQGSHWMIYPANPEEAESENYLSDEGLDDMSLVALGENGSFTTHADAIVKAVDSDVIAIEKGESAGSFIVKPLAEGSSEVTVTLGPEVRKFNVEVAPKPQVSFTVNPESIEDLIVGYTATIEVEFAEGVENVAATFESADETIATVDENGVVTGVAPGETRITVTVDEVEQVVTVKVRAPKFAFEVTPEAVAVGTGLTASLNVNITEDEFVEGTEHTFTYTSADEAIATVSDEGIVTGIAKGETVVTIACEGVEVEVPVTVSKVAEGISLTLTDIVTTRGTNHIITATLIGDPDVQKVEFKSNDPSVARLSRVEKLSATVSAIDYGDTTVDVKTIDGSMLTVSCRVRVADITTGIDEISIDGETARVYTLSGIEIKGNLNELPAGVYIFKTSKASMKISWNK